MKFQYTIQRVAMLLLFSGSIATFATPKYWVKLSNKNNSPYSLNNPQAYLSERAINRRERQGIPMDSTDLPLTPSYVDSIKATGATVLCQSKWLNALTVETSQPELISALSFVDTVQLSWVEPLTKSARLKLENQHRTWVSDTTESMYGPSYTQISLHNGHKMHQAGFTGEGMLIAVLDAGFLNADKVPSLQHLYNEGRILGTHDFVNPSSDIYREHYHGMEVLSTMGAYAPGVLVGTAYNATYYLIRTEDAASEQPVEMDYWIAGAELADSLGADLINSSLGYYFWDAPFESNTYSDMDGATLRTSIGAELAAKKGMIITSSSGNEGNVPYKKLISPSDARGVVGVGSVGAQVNGTLADSVYTPFSSRGYSADGRVKPNLCAKGYLSVVQFPNGDYGFNNGTSFSSPILCGMLAVLWQALPHYSASQIVELAQQNAHQFLGPDMYLGYGIPDIYKAYNLATTLPDTTHDMLQVFPNPFHDYIRFVLPGSTTPIHVEMYSVTGRLVKSEGIATQEQFYYIKTNTLPQGVYVLRVGTQEGTYTQKLLKK